MALDYAANDDERAAIALIAGDGARLTGRYGARSRVPGTTSRPFHPGLDIAGRLVGDPVPLYAPRSFASVWYSSKDAKGALDLFLGTKDDGLRYVHNSKHIVTRGRVAARELVARMGMTGDVNGVHVHLERWERGVQVDPLPWLISLTSKATAPAAERPTTREESPLMRVIRITSDGRIFATSPGKVLHLQKQAEVAAFLKLTGQAAPVELTSQEAYDAFAIVNQL